MTTATAEEPFDIARPQVWEDYAQCLHFFLEAQDIADTGKKRSTFLSRCSPAAFHLVKVVMAPAQLKDIPFETILASLRDHLARKPPELARRYEVHCCDQAPCESATACLAALRTTAQHCNINDLDTALRD
ncbi:hypothetical protein HPB52_011447 [Rhipicephalus sanguineus]|uniref:Uncharacterized protein n=1 Tax=Rhipicephalus sanguineus TaxID=34632 RepID=A0A9D4PB82_RHISA|nr:hypothetical protein HPB52_011447 [Rhipicephalus sanguineus]